MESLNGNIKTGQDFEKFLTEGTEEELDGLKAWLFQENIRIQSEQTELKSREEKFFAEKKQFQSEMADVNRRLRAERKRLKQDEAFFDKKMDILKNGFLQLEEDRRRFEREKISFEARREERNLKSHREMNQDMGEMLFQGVNSLLALKKRYKDLLKMFHPDNIAGDHEMVVVINRAYEKLKKEYEIGKQAWG